MINDYQHKSVLKDEVLELLAPKANQNFVDCTLGGGGHSEELLKKTSPKGKVLAFELDSRAIMAAKLRLKDYKDRLIIVNKSYVHLQSELKKQGLDKNISGILLDLGLSSDQLDKANRGFSFKDHGPLDMRFDPAGQALTASDIILSYSLEDLSKIFQEYGGDKMAKRLAKGIVSWREKQKQNQAIKTSMLVSVILQILHISDSALKKFRIHPATKVFQALRIAVNDELDNVTKVLPQAIEVLPKGGKLAVISFHSLEDRIVKHYFKSLLGSCICPPDAPICTCGTKASIKILTKKGLRPSTEEVKKNPRSRSATLRVVEKI
jgi:16S rRNA (cytosine1402-N4)-methyltransferase